MSRQFLLNATVASAFSASGLLVADSAIKGAALLVIAGIVALGLGRDSAATRHWVWLVAIVALLFVPWMSVVLPQWRVLPSWATMEALEDRPASAATEIRGANIGLPGSNVSSQFENLPLPSDQTWTSMSATTSTDNGRGQEVVGNQSTSLSAVVATPASRWNWQIAFTICWAIGFVLLLLRLAIARAILWQTERGAVVEYDLRKTGLHSHRIEQSDRIEQSAEHFADTSCHAMPRKPADMEIIAAFTEACTQLGIKKRIKLLIHSHKTIPVVWGIVRHRLLLPEVAKQWSKEQLRSVLLHELAHIKRRDALSQLLAQTACALHWFNPLVWLAAWRLHVERERACDDLVLASGVRASAYAEHLLNVATRLTSSQWTQACGLAMARSSSLHGRLAAVLNAKQNRRSLTSALLAFSIVVSAAIAIPIAMMGVANEAVAIDTDDEQNDRKAVTKKTLEPWAYDGVDVALLKRWQQLEKADSIPESRVAILRSSIGRFVESIDTSPFTLSQEQIRELKRLQMQGVERGQHTAAETQELIKRVFAIHGEPIQMAFNEAPWPGTPGNVAELNKLAFGPPDAKGLRVAMVCRKEVFVFGDSARMDLQLWNTGNETILVGIGRDGPGLYPELELQATHRDGRRIATTLGPEPPILKDTKFAKSWELRPGETADVFGYRLRVGSGAPREAEGYPQWYSLIEIPEVQHGDEIVLTGSLPPLTQGDHVSPEKLQTDSIRIKAIAPEEVEIWTANSAGSWPMPGGVTLKVNRELFHAADIATSVVLTWPQDESGTTYAFNSSVASDVFAIREPWYVAWQRNSTSFWTMRGNLGNRGPGLAVPFCVKRIDFADKSKILSTTWYHRPKEMPEGIRAAFEKVFQALPTAPRRASEADGFVQTDEAHDVRPIEELLRGAWKSKTSDVNVQMSFPEKDTDRIQCKLDFGQGSPVVESAFSRIRYPANNSIRLWMQPSQPTNVDEKDIIGNVRRGPDSTLLLDITGSPKYPDYKKVKGIVLVRMPASETNAAVPNQISSELVHESDPTILPDGLEQHLDWSKPVGGLRMALMIRAGESQGKLGKERKIFLVIQNVTDQPIRFCDSEIHETKVPASDVEGRHLFLQNRGEIMFGLQHAISSHIDIVLQPRDVHLIDMFDREQDKARGSKTGDGLAEGIVKVPTQSLFAELKIDHAPKGAWTGKLTTPTTRGAFAAEGKMPISKEGQALFRYAIDRARLNGDIPGGIMSRLHDLVQEFIRLNAGDASGDPYAKKMQLLLTRFELKGDWKQADVVSLFDEIAAVTTIPLERTMNAIRENSLQRGQALPNSLMNANWGEALPGGLRMAWVLEPREKTVHLGSSLKSRVVLHNSGKEPVMFVTRSFQQPQHSAVSASGTAMQMESTYWTTIGRPEPYRLRPGEYCELNAPGIGIGARNKNLEDWSNVRAGTWILAGEGEEIAFHPGTIKLTGDHNEQIDPDWWLKFITERIQRDAPLPADGKEREVILFRVISDLFGGSPTPEEATAFLSDNTTDAVNKLARLLSTRTWHKSVTGPIKSGEVRLKVLPADPIAATRPRVTMNPGYYNIGDQMRFVVSRRPVGERILNEANIVWYPPGKENVPTEVPLPNDYDTWAAGWSPGTTILWVSQKGLLRSYDYTDNASLKETRYEGEQITNAPIRADVREALRIALEKAVPQQMPAPQPPAALAPEKQANYVRPPGVEPKDELSKMIMEAWRKVARSDGKIPGATVSALESHVKEFSTNFPNFESVLSRFDATRDWTESEAIAMLNAVAEIETLPINRLINEYRFSKPANIRLGKPLSADLANASWGKPLENGLRSACLIEPHDKEVAVGSLMKVRVLVHNSGKESLTFLSPRHAVPDGLRASNAPIHIVPWSHFVSFERIRLDPGHYIEQENFDVAIEDHYDDKKAHTRVVIEAKPDSELQLSFSVDLSEEFLPQSDGLKAPETIRMRTIANRVAEEAPLPASAGDRELLLRHVVLDLFGEPPTADEITEFTTDHSPESLTKLAARLQTRKEAALFVGVIPSGEASIRVGPVTRIQNAN